ncbi:tetratricopeptide repeat protein [Glycomyces sp. NPDC046736]|uniref:tetratricopeptide repeat protein n=1 Tax=Glycomyces sp. NPDC046736 TaxID=3155615 RepID=UPI0033CA4251
MNNLVQGGVVHIGKVELRETGRGEWRDYWHPGISAEGFVGRERELQQMREALDGAGVARIQSLGGLGGIGKTKLAVAFASVFADRYDGKVFYDFQSYTPGSPPHDADQALMQILPTIDSQLQAIEVERMSPEGRLSAWRGRTAGRRLLIVWDNVKHAAQLEGLLFRDQPGCATIITSRDLIALDSATRPLMLDALEPEAATALFTEIAGKEHPSREVEQLVKWDHHLPVLIEMHAQQVRYGERSLAEIIGDLTAEPDLDTREVIFARFDGSYAHLTDDQRFTLRVFGAHAGTTPTAASLAAALGCDVTETHALMNALIRTGFVRRHFHDPEVDDPGMRAYTAHDTVRLYAAHRARAEGDFDAARAELVRYSRNLAGRYFHFGAPLVDVEFDNQRDLALAGTTRKYALLAEITGLRAYALGRYGDGETLNRHAAQVFEEVGDQAGLARAMHGLAEVMRGRDEYEKAIRYFERAGDLFGDVGDLSGKALAVQGLAHIDRVRGLFEKAESSFEYAAGVFGDLGERDRHAHAVWGLGDVALMLGRHRAARYYFEEAAQEYEITGNARGLGHSIQGLGRVALDLRDFDLAIALFTRSGEIYESIGHDLGRAFSLQGLGGVESGQGEHRNAVVYLTQAEAIHRAAGSRRELADVLRELARATSACGDHGTARGHLREAIAIYSQLGRGEDAQAASALLDET